MLKITLIAAWLTQSESDKARIPLGVMYLAGYLQKKGFNVEVKDCQLQPSNISAIATLLNVLQNSAPIIGISCMSNMLPSVLVATEQLKTQYPDKVIILGGPGPTGVAEEILRNFKFIDYVITGEGEETLSDLLEVLMQSKKAKHLDLINGLCFRVEDNLIFKNPPRVRIKNLDFLNPIPYSQFSLEDYASTSPISTSRGCSYGCSFCDVVGIWQRQVTWRNTLGVIDELRYLEKNGKSKFAIVDDTFILDRRRVETFCDLFQKTKIPLTWHCNARINMIDESLLALMADSGCRSLFFGVESGSDQILKRIRKAFNLAKIYEVVELAAKYIPIITVSFIWGYPFETWEDFQKTRECYFRLRNINNIRFQIYKLQPLPQSLLYKEFGRDLLYLPDIEYDTNLASRLGDDESGLIRNYPKIFPNYYHYHTAQMDLKHQVINEDRKNLNC